jgi:formate/nitrite transporter
VGIAKLLAGVLFPAGLMFVVLCGGELFTGNCLIVMSCLDGKSKWIDFAKNLFFVYIGNLIGSVFIALLIYKSGQLNFTLGALGGYTIKTAAYKVNLTFSQAFCSAIMCNWLVCLAVWMAYGAKDMTGKIWGIFFPIFLFILSGFEHCVANMYYISAGMMAATNADYLQQATNVYGVTKAALAKLNITGFFIKNLLPVTLGNMVGGGIFVGMIYFFIYIHKTKQK